MFSYSRLFLKKKKPCLLLPHSDRLREGAWGPTIIWSLYTSPNIVAVHPEPFCIITSTYFLGFLPFLVSMDHKTRSIKNKMNALTGTNLCLWCPCRLGQRRERWCWATGTWWRWQPCRWRLLGKHVCACSERWGCKAWWATRPLPASLVPLPAPSTAFAHPHRRSVDKNLSNIIS